MNGYPAFKEAGTYSGPRKKPNTKLLTPRLHYCDQIDRRNVMKWYICYYSIKVNPYPYGPMIDAVNLIFARNREIDKVSMDKTFELMTEEARRGLEDTQSISRLRSEINQYIAELAELCRPDRSESRPNQFSSKLKDQIFRGSRHR